MPHESPLHIVHSLGCDEGSLSLSELTVLCTNLSNKVTSLEVELAQTKQTYGNALTKLIKKVKKLEYIVKSTQARRRFRIVVSGDEEDEEGLEDPSKQGRKITEIDQDPSISLHNTVIPEVSTVAENLVYIRRSAEKKKDKGKGIMTEPEPEKKTKKQLEQERLRHEEVVRLQEQLNEEETQRITRDAEIARHLHEEINKAGQERVVAKDDQAHVIDWSDPAVLRYHAQLNRPYSVAKVRKNMVMIKFNPLDPWILKKKKGSEKKGSRKKSLARKRACEKQSEESTKRQKIEDDIEKEELKAYLDLVPREEFSMEIEFVGTKYLIVDWKTHVLTENFMYYQIIKADGGSKNYKIFSEILDDFDRQDGDLKILFQPKEEDEVWRHQHKYKLISWRLFDSCGIHILLMDNGIAIHMMIEKKYPLTQEMISKMLSKKLKVDHESTMAYELLRFIRSQVQKQKNVWKNPQQCSLED
ncbi:hypothetical protein Tco_1070668 [Tanacetum coccineum]|uniref:Uncharacterized protein n=1 Tax=Tanacetum coccineum TaxID=301880 RepID=A0ABQ5HM82_9ASTR